jgi:hypothetical protein
VRQIAARALRISPEFACSSVRAASAARAWNPLVHKGIRVNALSEIVHDRLSMATPVDSTALVHWLASEVDHS